MHEVDLECDDSASETTASSSTDFDDAGFRCIPEARGLLVRAAIEHERREAEPADQGESEAQGMFLIVA